MSKFVVDMNDYEYSTIKNYFWESDKKFYQLKSFVDSTGYKTVSYKVMEQSPPIVMSEKTTAYRDLRLGLLERRVSLRFNSDFKDFGPIIEMEDEHGSMYYVRDVLLHYSEIEVHNNDADDLVSICLTGALNKMISEGSLPYTNQYCNLFNANESLFDDEGIYVVDSSRFKKKIYKWMYDNDLPADLCWTAANTYRSCRLCCKLYYSPHKVFCSVKCALEKVCEPFIIHGTRISFIDIDDKEYVRNLKRKISESWLVYLNRHEPAYGNTVSIDTSDESEGDDSESDEYDIYNEYNLIS